MAHTGKKEITIRHRFGRHTGGTKWYRAVFISFKDGSDIQNYLVKLWGGNGKKPQYTWESSEIGNYEDIISKKQKMKSSNRYDFNPEEKIFFGVRRESGFIQSKLEQINFTHKGANVVHQGVNQVWDFLGALEGDSIPDELPEAVISEAPPEVKTKMHESWGAFA